MAWYDSGEGAEDRDRVREEEDTRKRAAYRFNLKPKGEAQVTLISCDWVFYKEHTGQSKINGQNRYWQKTCLGDRNEDGEEIICPFCVNKTRFDRMLYVGTIINHTGYTTADGRVIKHIKQPLIVKSDAKAEVIRQRNQFREDHGADASIAWTAWNIRRSGDTKGLSTGQYFEIRGKRSKAKLLELLRKEGNDRDDLEQWLTPFNPLDLMAPMTEAEAYQFLGIPFNRPGRPVQEEEMDSNEPVPFDEEDEEL